MEAESSLKRPRRDGWRLRHVLCMSLTARAAFKSAEKLKSPDPLQTILSAVAVPVLIFFGILCSVGFLV